MEKKALIFNIQRFSVYDGPGIRTTVFMKGCNLRCKWCHNPESLSNQPQLSYSSEKCIGCGRCVSNCQSHVHEFDSNGIHKIYMERCKSCFKCVLSCYPGALQRIGAAYTPSELLSEIITDKKYFNNSTKGGGVTFSGGECMLQLEFLKELLPLCKQEEISIAIDTAGHVAYESFLAINDYVDYYLYDIKAYDEELHKQLTGVSNKQILQNIINLQKAGKEIIVRIPVIMGGNDGDMKAIAAFLKENNITQIELLSYHNMGDAKLELIMKPIINQSFKEPSKEEMAHIVEIFKSFKLHPKI